MLHQRLAGSARRRGRARASCWSSSASPTARRPAHRHDVEGDAAAARDRAGAGRRRRSCCCSTSRPARSTPPGGAPSASCSSTCASAGSRVLLNSHLLSEVELICDRVAIIDHGEVVAPARRPSSAAPGGVRGRDRRRRAPLPRREARGRAGIVRDLVAAGERGLRRARAHAPRSRTPTSRRSARRRPRDAAAASPSIAGFALRESLRRRVFLVVGLLTVAFLVLYGLGTWQAFKAARDFAGPTQSGVEPEVVAGATLARPRDVRDPLPRHGPRRLPHARGGPRRRGARAPAADARPPGAAPHAALRPLARRRRRVRAPT